MTTQTKDTSKPLRIHNAVEALIPGGTDSEKQAMAQILSGTYDSFMTATLNARSTIKPGMDEKRLRFMALAIHNIGECLTTLSSVMISGLAVGGFSDSDTGKLSGVIAGLDRAVCALDCKPYSPRASMETIRDQFDTQLLEAVKAVQSKTPDAKD
jgi:hypothetical protein